jgi:tight adherence protein B
MMLFYVALALLLIALIIFSASTVERVGSWWSARTGKYASWMTIEFEGMFRELSTDKANRIITGTTLGGLLIGLLLGDGLLGRVIAMTILGLAGYFGPWGIVLYMRYKRLDAIDNQLVDSLLLMSNGLKAGLSLQQAMELVVREIKPPMSDEFGRMVKEIHLGRLTDDALRRFRERVPLEDVNIAVEAILTLRETGGNLSETFDVIAHTITERKKVQGKIKSLTAQGMSQGVLVCLMPWGMMLLFSMLDASYMAPFFTTALGWMMITTVFVLDAAGMYLMFHLVKVDV